MDANDVRRIVELHESGVSPEEIADTVDFERCESLAAVDFERAAYGTPDDVYNYDIGSDYRVNDAGEPIGYM